MARIEGLGEIESGVLERDPLDDTYQIRTVDSEGRQKIRRLQDVFAEYVGREVRFTLARVDALEAAAARFGVAEEVHSVSFEDLAKGASKGPP